MNTAEMNEVLKNVHYNTGWKFYVYDELAPYGTGKGTDSILKPGYLQVKFRDRDGFVQFGRKWKVSEHMTKSELVQTAFKAVLTAQEHEIREQFLYKGRPIFSPHYDVDKLWELADPDGGINFDVRENPEMEPR